MARKTAEASAMVGDRWRSIEKQKNQDETDLFEVEADGDPLEAAAVLEAGTLPPAVGAVDGVLDRVPALLVAVVADLPGPKTVVSDVVSDVVIHHHHNRFSRPPSASLFFFLFSFLFFKDAIVRVAPFILRLFGPLENPV